MHGCPDRPVIMIGALAMAGAVLHERLTAVILLKTREFYLKISHNRAKRIG